MADSKKDDSVVNLTIENDLFANTDRHYTNGLRLSYLLPKKYFPTWLRQAYNALPFTYDQAHKRVSFAMGQNMFTPRDIRVPNLIQDDRPYAGWTYVSLGIVADHNNFLDSLQLSLGIVGPDSKAEQAQKIVHRIINSDKPNGWHNQLKNEPGIILTYQRKWHNFIENKNSYLDIDVSPHAGITVGNVYTYGSTGITFRLGYDLPADYGPPTINPNLPGSDYFKTENSLSAYIFGGIEGRIVGRNIFLDGNSFRESHSVDKHIFTGDMQVGIALIIDSFRIAYTHTFRSAEFKSQQTKDQFGALTISRKF